MKKLFTIEIGAAISNRFQRRLSEWHIAGVMTLVGCILLFAPTFDLPPYVTVLAIANQPTWATVMVLVGGARIAVLVVNGAMPHLTTHLRYVFSSLSALVWTALLAGLSTFSTPLLLGPFIGAAIIVDLISAYRAAQDARKSDDESGAGNGIFR